MEDYIVRATTKNEEIRAFAATTRNMVNSAQKIHNTSEVSSAALGRTLTATAIMGLMLKDDDDLITISIKGDGPIGGILATGNNKGQVKGYAFNNDVKLPLKSSGKIDVSTAIGCGNLSVIKDLGLKKPYVGQVPIQSGEIAEDITYYFAQSEQTPSVVALGVLVDVDYSIKEAGGFIIQLMPFASEETITKIEAKIKDLPSITTLLDEGKSPEQILSFILEDFGVNFLEKIPVQYYCNCSKDRVEKALISIGRKDLVTILEEDKKAEVKCHFCDKIYDFTEEDLTQLLLNC